MRQFKYRREAIAECSNCHDQQSCMDRPPCLNRREYLVSDQKKENERDQGRDEMKPAHSIFISRCMPILRFVFEHVLIHLGPRNLVQDRQRILHLRCLIIVQVNFQRTIVQREVPILRPVCAVTRDRRLHSRFPKSAFLALALLVAIELVLAWIVVQLEGYRNRLLRQSYLLGARRSLLDTRPVRIMVHMHT